VADLNATRSAILRAVKAADWEPGDAQRALQELRDDYDPLRSAV
jgi:hypothetical protein